MAEDKNRGQARAKTVLPDEIYEALFDRYEQEGGVANRRQYERKPWPATITFSVVEIPGRSAVEQQLEVTTHDVSRGGIGVVLQQFLDPGTSVRIRFNSLPDRPVVNGVVANCTYIGGKQHRVGVQFVSSASET